MPKVMQEAMPLEDFKDWDFKGSPPRKRVRVGPPEPKPPKVKNALHFDKIDRKEILEVLEGRRKVLKNREGVRFMGYHLALQMKDNKILEGWMSEADFTTFRRLLFREGNVNVDNLEF